MELSVKQFCSGDPLDILWAARAGAADSSDANLEGVQLGAANLSGAEMQDTALDPTLRQGAMLGP